MRKWVGETEEFCSGNQTHVGSHLPSSSSILPSSGSTFPPALLVRSYLTSPVCLPLPVSRERVLQGPAQELVLRLSGLGKDGGWDFPAHPLPSPAPVGLLSQAHCSQAYLTPFLQPGLPHTLALGYTGGAIEVSACVSWTAGAEVLTEVRLIGPHGTADAAMDTGVVVVPRGALDCRQGGKGGVKVAGKWEFWDMGWAGLIHPGESGD